MGKKNQRKKKLLVAVEEVPGTHWEVMLVQVLFNVLPEVLQ